MVSELPAGSDRLRPYVRSGQRALSRRNLLRGSIVGAAALATGACAFAPQATNASATASPSDTEPAVVPQVDGDLVYFNWADYVDPSVFAGFSKEYGVKIIQSSFDSMEAMVAKMNAGNAYDVIFPSAKWTQRLAEAGKLHRIDHSKMTNAEAIFGTYTYFANPWYDPHSAHSIPFSMYKTGIGWRKDKLGDLTGSWSDLWNATSAGRTFVLDDRDEALGMAALRLGFDLNTAKADELAKMVTELKSLRGDLRGFDSDDYDNLLNGDAWMTQAWSGDMTTVLNSAKNASNYGFEVAKEGSPINSDCYAIPSNAPHPGTAALFIDYMLRPENVTKNIEYIGYPMPVKGTESTYEALVANLPQCVVTVDDLSKNLFFRNGTQAQEQARDAAWTDVKAG
jgi:spermidine/putrescine transport system substrate-binding protein